MRDERDQAELLADLLDGRVGAHEVPSELAELARLATAVRTHVVAPLPTPDFRAALQERVVDAAAGNSAAAGAASAPATAASGSIPGVGAAGAAGAGTSAWVGSLVAGVTATAVLLGGGLVAGSSGAVPGDLLYGVKQRVEQLRLGVVDGDREARLLVQHATERVREAVALVDAQPVDDLLARSTELVASATAVAVPGELEEQLATYRGTLRVLASRTDDPAVDAAVAAILDDLRAVEPGPGPSPEPPVVPVPSSSPDTGTEPTQAPVPDTDATPAPSDGEDPAELPDLPDDGPSLPTELPTEPPDGLDLPDVGQTPDTVGDLLP